MMRKSAGFSLIELMIAAALALIVVGSATAFMVSTMRANATNVASTRLNQELRASVRFAIAELRRARYMRDSISFVGEAKDDDNGDGVVDSKDWLPSSPFDAITVSGAGADDGDAATDADGQCVAYSYDHLTENRFRTIGRRDVDDMGGVFFGSGAAASPACDSVGTRITSREVDITLFAINFNTTTDWVRVTAEGRLRSGQDLMTRRYSEAVRIRSQVVPPLPALPPAP